MRPRRRRGSIAKVAAASLCGFVLTIGVVLAVARPSLGGPDCVGESCALYLIAVLHLAAVVGFAVGATCGLATYVFIRWRSGSPR